MNKGKKVFSTLTVMVLLFLLASPLIAQGWSSLAEPIKEYVTDEEFEKMVNAYRKIALVRHKYDFDLRYATNPENRWNIEHKAQREAIRAIEESGLSVEEYNKIMRRINADKRLARRFQRLIEY
ncbi:DUF4168 domain-containing protein [Chitinispirillales bacterium ANBcel5]|uniref:DUF4168 domain-containing protein n=1 Tax=Cellulosispirillum alkaliphilum TaxID=3039283 RepID=UPI002A5086AC|nr:DUF4168 domain-containing protein [Chitinispirillales bacterium ANBcel5]